MHVFRVVASKKFSKTIYNAFTTFFDSSRMYSNLSMGIYPLGFILKNLLQKFDVQNGVRSESEIIINNYREIISSKGNDAMDVFWYPALFFSPSFFFSFFFFFFSTQRGWIYHFSMGEGKKEKKKKYILKSIFGSHLRVDGSRRFREQQWLDLSNCRIYTIYFLTNGKEKSDLRNIREFYCFFLFILGQIHWSTIWKWTGNVDTFDVWQAGSLEIKFYLSLCIHRSSHLD